MIGVGFFFFSSRRRHTRYWRDWSSDVCSSDLKAEGKAIPLFLETLLTPSRRGRKPKQKLFPFFFQTLLTDLRSGRKPKERLFPFFLKPCLPPQEVGESRSKNYSPSFFKLCLQPVRQFVMITSMQAAKASGEKRYSELIR